MGNRKGSVVEGDSRLEGLSRVLIYDEGDTRGKGWRGGCTRDDMKKVVAKDSKSAVVDPNPSQKKVAAIQRKQARSRQTAKPGSAVGSNWAGRRGEGGFEGR
jgi:hypothetical protein